jgi:hypothetical protein
VKAVRRLAQVNLPLLLQFEGAAVPAPAEQRLVGLQQSCGLEEHEGLSGTACVAELMRGRLQRGLRSTQPTPSMTKSRHGLRRPPRRWLPCSVGGRLPVASFSAVVRRLLGGRAALLEPLRVVLGPRWRLRVHREWPRGRTAGNEAVEQRQVAGRATRPSERAR